MTHATRLARTYIIKTRNGQVISAITTSDGHIKDIVKQLRRELGQEVRLCR